MICVASFADAQIIVSDAILEFSNKDRLIESIAVGNTSQNRALNVTAEVFEVQNPGQENETQTITNTVFVVPEKFSLSPRTQRTVRLASKKRFQKEKIYRVVFYPKNSKEKEREASELEILTSTTVMVILNPPNPKDDLTWVREDARIVFENTGNTNIILRQKGMCNKETSCRIEGQRLWPGDQWILNLPSILSDDDLTLEYRALGDIKEVTIPYEE
jgi:P pilus assembly chaperone PapD